MSRNEVRAAGAALLDFAPRVRAGYPDLAAMGRVAVQAAPADGDGEAPAVAAALRAIRSLRAEVLLVQRGVVGTVSALVDEMAALRRLLAVL